MENNNKENKLCQICKEIANYICYDCSSYLCDSCFKFIHDKTVNSEHKKEEIDPFISINIRCPRHPKIPMSLFCLNENSKKKYYNIVYRNILFTLLYYRRT